MYDVKDLKDKIINGGIALSIPLEQRILNDQMTEADHIFISKSLGLLRDIKKNGIPEYVE